MQIKSLILIFKQNNILFQNNINKQFNSLNFLFLILNLNEKINGLNCISE